MQEDSIVQEHGASRSVSKSNPEQEKDAGKICDTCSTDDCAAKSARPNEKPEDFEDRQALHSRLCKIKHKVIVMSGKGGVGKSMVAVNLAVSLAGEGKKVSLLDVDIHGPSIPIMMGLEGAKIQAIDKTILPVNLDGMQVMSIGFLLRNREDAVIWRGPMKMGIIKQFLKDVEWGEQDYLVIDSPPGTGDEPLSVCQLIEDLDGAVIVTTPQETATVDVRKSINFCRQLNLKVLGVIENMSGFICPGCGKVTNIFNAGGGERMAREMDVPFLGRIPVDPRIAEAGDEGVPYMRKHEMTGAAEVMRNIFGPVLDL